MRTRAATAAKTILDRTRQPPRVALLLGTGHSSIAGQLKDKHIVKAGDLPEGLRFSGGSALVSGLLEDVPVVVADAPLAPYEGYSPEAVTFPVRVLRAMGAQVLILTAAGASLTLQLEPGMISVIEDHLNFSGIHPLQGPHDAELGPRFPDMSNPYDHALQRTARSVSLDGGIPCAQAVFAAVPGPSLPTRAEYRAYRRLGADLVGMSLVPEVLAAVHSGFRVLALVGVTQMVNPESHKPVSIEAMIEAADLAAPRMAAMLTGVVRRLP
ncbi:MAG: purine-nucleoside phosphorylase [Planctomycetota bacterium]